MLVNPTTKQRPNIVRMKGSALQLFELFQHFDVVFIVVHSF